MADPRAEALLRALSGGAGGMPTGPEEMMEGEMPPEGGEGTLEATVGQCLAALEPFIDDPRIAQAASLLQEVAAGPSEMPEDSIPSEAAEPTPE